MRGGSRFYWLAGGSLLAVLLALAGCGRGSVNWGAAEREAWRTQAEAECIKSGAVKPTAAVVRMDPVGDGYCGANYPFKVAALGEGSTAMGYAEPPRPPGAIPVRQHAAMAGQRRALRAAASGRSHAERRELALDARPAAGAPAFRAAGDRARFRFARRCRDRPRTGPRGTWLRAAQHSSRLRAACDRAARL